MKCIFLRESGRQPRQIAKQIMDTIHLGISIASKFIFHQIHAMEFTNCLSVFAGRRHGTREATTMTAEQLFNRKFIKNVNATIFQYPDVSIGDRSDFNLNFSLELCKRVRHPSPHLTLLGGLGRPRIWMSARVWTP